MDIEQGRVTASVGENEEEEDDEDTINTFLLSPDNEQVISNHRSGLFKLWKWKGAFTFIYVFFVFFDRYLFIFRDIKNSSSSSE